LETQVKKYISEVKEQLLKQLGEGHSTPSQARQFMALLLEEHENYRTAIKTIGSFIQQLVCYWLIYIAASVLLVGLIVCCWYFHLFFMVVWCACVGAGAHESVQLDLGVALSRTLSRRHLHGCGSATVSSFPHQPTAVR
jgi:hypothetical protein